MYISLAPYAWLHMVERAPDRPIIIEFPVTLAVTAARPAAATKCEAFAMPVEVRWPTKTMETRSLLLRRRKVKQTGQAILKWAAISVRMVAHAGQAEFILVSCWWPSVLALVALRATNRTVDVDDIGNEREKE